MRPQNNKERKTSERLIKLVQADPTLSLEQLRIRLQLSSTSNVHYHLRRLQAAGKIQWRGSVRRRGNETPANRQRRLERGDVPLPKLTEAQLQRNMNRVVAQAQARERTPSVDVVQISASPLFHNDRLRARRIG